MQRTDSLEKPLMFGKIEGRRRRGRQSMRWLDVSLSKVNGCECEQALGVGDGQGSLACCSSWGLKESDMTEQLNCFLSYLLTSLFYISTFFLFFIISFLII